MQEVLEAGSYGYQVDNPLEAIRLLLQHGADPNERWCPFESRGNGAPSCTTETAITPLIFTTIVGATDISAILLEAGADPRARDWGGASALDYADDPITFELISRAMFPDFATRDARAWDWVSHYEGGPNARGLGTTNALTRAMDRHTPNGISVPEPPISASDRAQRRSLARMEILLTIGADPNQRLTADKADWTPLAVALASSNYRAAALLLRNGADANARWCANIEYRQLNMLISEQPGCSNTNGTTPLMFAASRDDLNSLRVLLAFKADRSLFDWQGRTAVDYARTPAVRALLTN